MSETTRDFRIEIGMGGGIHEMRFSGPLTERSVQALEINIRLFREMFAEQEAKRVEKIQFFAAMEAEYGPARAKSPLSPDGSAG